MGGIWKRFLNLSVVAGPADNFFSRAWNVRRAAWITKFGVRSSSEVSLPGKGAPRALGRQAVNVMSNAKGNKAKTRDTKEEYDVW